VGRDTRSRSLTEERERREERHTKTPAILDFAISRGKAWEGKLPVEALSTSKKKRHVPEIEGNVGANGRTCQKSRSSRTKNQWVLNETNNKLMKT